jgi:hypothetical protein
MSPVRKLWLVAVAGTKARNHFGHTCSTVTPIALQKIQRRGGVGNLNFLIIMLDPTWRKLATIYNSHNAPSHIGHVLNEGQVELD